MCIIELKKYLLDIECEKARVLNASMKITMIFTLMFSEPIFTRQINFQLWSAHVEIKKFDVESFLSSHVDFKERTGEGGYNVYLF